MAKEIKKSDSKAAFTLAKVLITLAIIGVVAALTIPTLWAKVGTKVSENQVKVFQAKLIKGLNLAKTAGDIHDKYTSTEDFLRNGLAKHYKMVSICGVDNLRDCIPYDEIKYMDGEEEKTVKVADLKTAESIKLEAPFEDTAAFVTADGIPVLLSYDKTYTVDTEKLDRSISSCVAGIYDINGSKAPNKYGFTLDDDGKTIKAFTNDLRGFNGGAIGSSYPEINGVEIVVKAFYPKDVYGSEGVESHDNDYWTAAKSYCKNNNAQLPDGNQLAQIAQLLYDDIDISTSSTDDYRFSYGDKFYDSSYSSNRWDDTNQRAETKVAVFNALGIEETTYLYLWSSAVRKASGNVFMRMFLGNMTRFIEIGRSDSTIRAICVGK